MTETDIVPEQPRKKRKYTKRAKMLLRSNNDYIDHTYWPRMYAQSKKKHERMMAKYGVKALPNNAEPNGEVKTRKLTEAERAEFTKQGIGQFHKVPVTKDEPLHRIPMIDE